MPYGGEAWLVTRMADVREALADPRLSRVLQAAPDRPRFFPEPIVEGIGIMDPPEQTRLRRLVAKAFTARRVQEFEPRIQVIVDELLDAIEAKGGPVDLYAEFSWPLPGISICEFMGIPYEDRDRFVPFFDSVVSTTAKTPDEIRQAVMDLHAYFTELIEKRRADPRDDLFTALIRASDEGDRLSEKELIEMSFGLLVAGMETTASQLVNFLYLLFRNPDQLELLRAKPELVPNAIEELLRFVPLLAVDQPAVAREDLTIGGVLIRAGETVVPSMNAANRDPEVFANPQSIDITREHNPHLAFSHGAHHCVGAQLARLEMQAALRSLVARFPGLRQAVPDEELRWKAGVVLRGVEALPVEW
ncbi:cytochrome P450 [Streptomyces sp. TBY4]|uniref:cytochrome P450 n=1 Tax=Streptomyces sp. TBY4 TaxID=2962030 RepID=UPI0020B68120|nr:cytochrome P450 [Streptomyces sp. TBY4]MCP3759176.1 cytochrome P450 [Streptomyces sp. TBY4]